MLTQDQLVKLLHYDPEGGVFTRRTSARGVRAGIAGSTAKLGRDKSYVRVRVLGKDYYAHRLAWLYMTGRFPDGEVDHEDGDGTNNKWDNIKRCVDHRTNSRNRSLSSRNKSGVMGVQWDVRRKLWRARLCIDGKDITLGRFSDKGEAEGVVKAARAEHGFHKNHGQPRPY